MHIRVPSRSCNLPLKYRVITAGVDALCVVKGTHHKVPVRLHNDKRLAVGRGQPSVLLQGLPGLQGVTGWRLCRACSCSTT